SLFPFEEQPGGVGADESLAGWMGGRVSARSAVLPGPLPIRMRTGSTLVPGSFCIAASIALLVLPEGLSGIPIPILVWSTAIITFWLARRGFILSRRLGENPWLAPRSLLMMFYFFKFGWGCLIIYYWDSFPWEAIPSLKERFYAFGVRNNLDNACHLALLGAMGLFLGLSLPVNHLIERLPALKWPVGEQQFRSRLILYTPIALVLSIGLRFVLPVTIQQSVIVFGAVVSAMMVIAAYWLTIAKEGPERVKWIVFLSITVGISTTMGFTTGMVQEFLYPVVMVVWGYVLAKQTLPWKTLLVVGPLSFFLIFPWLTIYKYSGAMGPTMKISDRLDVANEKFRMTDYRTGLELTFDRFVARSSTIEPAVYQQFYPKVYPFLMGKSFLLELTALVPRVLWPEKIGLSEELNRYTAGVGMVREGDGTSAVFDLVSEYYINFGLIGVVLFTALQGVYETILFYWLTVRTNYLIGASIYAVLFFLNSEFFGLFYIFGWHTRMVPVWLLIFYFLSRRSSRRSQTAAPLMS
ncbi:MAG: hypothetical protein ABIZ80_21280, partial [Bryobacteraceae bacterium]